MIDFAHTVRCAAAGGAAGIAAGAIATVATAHTTDSVRTTAQALVLSLLLGACFAVAFAGVGAAVSIAREVLAARREDWQRLDRPTAVQVGTGVFALWGLLVGGLWLHDLVLGAPLPRLLARTVLVAVAALGAWLLARGAASPAVRRSVLLLLPALVVALLAVLLVPRMRPAAAIASPPAQTSATAAKVLLVGLDGADWGQLDQFIEAGRLPNFAKLAASGYRAPLETTRPTLSPILWTTIMSGMREDQHGIHGFTTTTLPGMNCGLQGVDKTARLPPKLGLGKLSEIGYGLGLLGLRPVSGCQRRALTLWNILSAAERTVGVVNWFVSWPADPVNGFMVSDYNPARAQFYRHDGSETASGYSGITYPENLLDELAQLDLPRLDARPSETLALPFFQDLSEEEIRELRRSESLDTFRAIHVADQFAAASTLHLLSKGQPDFAAFYVSGIDNVSHRWAFDYPPIVGRYYEWVDSLLGQVLETISEDTTIVIVSDHGWVYEPGRQFGHPDGPDGVLLATGPGIEPAMWSPTGDQTKPSILDVTPTILSFFGLPASREMSGRVLPLGINEPAPPRIDDYGDYVPPPVPDPSTNEEGSEETIEKLKALGYLS